MNVDARNTSKVIVRLVLVCLNVTCGSKAQVRVVYVVVIIIILLY